MIAKVASRIEQTKHRVRVCMHAYKARKALHAISGLVQDSKRTWLLKSTLPKVAVRIPHTTFHFSTAPSLSFVSACTRSFSITAATTAGAPDSIKMVVMKHAEDYDKYALIDNI